MPSVIIYRGHLGFQPNLGSYPAVTNAEPRKLESYIAAGFLHLPILRFDADVSDFGNDDRRVSNLMQTRNDYNYRWFQIDSEGKAACMAFYSQESVARPRMVKAGLLITGRSIFVDSYASEAIDFYRGLIEANATLEQIDAFETEYYVGEGCPFTWTPLEKVMDMIEASTKGPHSLARLRTEIPEPVIATKPTFGNIIPIPGAKPSTPPAKRTRRPRKAPVKKEVK